MSEQRREAQRAIGAWLPALEAFIYALQAGYLTHDPGCKTIAWRKVRMARDNLLEAVALFDNDQPKNLPTPLGG